MRPLAPFVYPDFTQESVSSALLPAVGAGDPLQQRDATVGVRQLDVRAVWAYVPSESRSRARIG